MQRARGSAVGVLTLGLAVLSCGEAGSGDDDGTGARGAGAQGGSTGATSGSGGAAASSGTSPLEGGAGGEAGAASVGPPECDPSSTGRALAFKGDVIDLVVGDLGGDWPGGNAARTVELWARFAGDASWAPNHTVIELGRRVDVDDQVFGFDLGGRNGDQGIFAPYTNNLGDNDPTPLTIPAEGWAHLAWGYDGAGHFQMVINGVLVPLANPGDGSGVLATLPGIITLGASQTFGWEGWEGAMDEVRLWSVFRSEAEIARDMRSKLSGYEPGLIAYYDFDKGSGHTVDDVLKTPGHKLVFCPADGGPCPTPNNADPIWVESDIPGPFTCAEKP